MLLDYWNLGQGLTKPIKLEDFKMTSSIRKRYATTFINKDYFELITKESIEKMTEQKNNDNMNATSVNASNVVYVDNKNYDMKDNIKIDIKEVDYRSRATFDFFKCRKVKSPSIGTRGSAGIDFYVPEFTEDFKQYVKEHNTDRNYIFHEKGDGGNIVFFEEGVNMDFNAEDAICLKPHSSIVIPTGIHVLFPESLVLVAFNKSGISTKKKLVTGACVCDSDYRGEIHFNMINTSNTYQLIRPNEKLLQFVLLQYFVPDFAEANSYDELYCNLKQTRFGGFGSTNEESK
jgi:dUTPase